jgi:hypothetical protein
MYSIFISFLNQVTQKTDYLHHLHIHDYIICSTNTKLVTSQYIRLLIIHVPNTHCIIFINRCSNHFNLIIFKYSPICGKWSHFWLKDIQNCTQSND